MSRRLAAWSLLLLSLAGGCPSECERESFYVTNSGKWRLATGQLRTDPCDLPGTDGHQQDEPLLVGTRWCPEFACADNPSCLDEILLECFEASVEGPGQTDGACLNVTGSGELVWRFDPLPCDQPGLFYPEQLRIRAVEASEVRGRLVPYLDTMARDNLVSGTGSFPLDATPPPDTPLLKLAADEPVQLAVNLWAGERRVAWSGDQASLEVEVLAGTAPVVAFGDAAATVRLQVPAGSEAALSLVVGANRIALGSVRGVAPDALKDLELVVAYQGDPANSGSQTPFGARAVARDGDGDLVYGAQPEWKVLAGSFAFTRQSPFPEDANYDYTALYDAEADPEKKQSSLCFPQPSSGSRSYTGRIAADVAGLHAEADLAWTFDAASAEEYGLFQQHRPGPNCEGPGYDEPGACNCDATNPSGPTLAFLALLALGTARRRRRRDVRTP